MPSTPVTTDRVPRLAAARGMAYVVLALGQLSAGFLAGGQHPARTALVPSVVALLGVAMIVHPRTHRRSSFAIPFFACALAALGMATAPATLAPFGLAPLTMSVVFGGVLLPKKGSVLLSIWAVICLMFWSANAGRFVLSDALLGASTIWVAATMALLTSHARQRAINQAQDARRDAEELSLRDPLTGLANRRAFDAEATLRAIEARLGGVLMVDIDHFKDVNDEYGHDAGDAVLKAVAQRLAGAIRRADLAARLGGDEFAVLLEGPLTLEGLRRVADAVRGATSAFAAATPDGAVRVTTSIGGALTELGSLPAQQVRAARTRADSALYKAKKGGRDRAILDGETRSPSARRGRRRPRSGPKAA